MSLPVPSVNQSVNPPAASLERQFSHGLGLIHRVRSFEMPAQDGWTGLARVRIYMYCASCEWLISPDISTN